LLRWGSSCGIPFDKNKFCDEHRQWDYLRDYLIDRPQQPWTVFSITKKYSKNATVGKRTKEAHTKTKTRRKKEKSE
jgi:hypothetical protein